MSSRENILKELKSLGIKPNKTFGQNFLVNPKIYAKIVEVSKLKKGDVILEIGPGIGTLTKYLIKEDVRVVVVEKDKRLIPILENKFDNLEVIEGDILKFNPHNHGLISGEYKIVANIPFYLTSRLLRVILEQWPQPELIVFMVQLEVARRIIAKPPKMNILAVSVQYFADVEIVSKVPKSNFWPAPKVDSAVIKIKPKNIEQNSEFLKTFFSIVKKGFSQKRKKLKNNLKQYLSSIEKVGIDPNNRAENLTLEDWIKLTEFISK